jgi:hypothetical protein
MNNKLLWSLAFVLFLALGAASFYYFYTAKKPMIPAETDGAIDRSPFGNSGLGALTREDGGLQTEEEGLAAVLPSLRKISSAPVAGAIVFNRNGEAVTRYIERGTGHLYEALGLAGSERISNTTIPKIYEAVWSNTGKDVLIRYIKDDSAIETFAIRVATSSSDTGSSLQGTFFPRSTASFALNPAGDKLFYVTTDDRGATGFISKLDGRGKTAIWTSPLKEWVVSWPVENTIALTTKPSALANGFLYFLNPTSGSVERVLGEVRGLTTLVSPDRSQVLYSESRDSSLALYLFDLKTGASKSLPLGTLAEKCVWATANSVYCASPKNLEEGDYPDVWYQGLVGFSDTIWKLDLSSGNARIENTLSDESGEEIDVLNPVMDRNGTTLLFMNKNDLSLWALSLSR